MVRTLLLILCSLLFLHQTQSQSLPSTFVEGGRRSYRHLYQWVLCMTLPAWRLRVVRTMMPPSDTACNQRKSGLLLLLFTQRARSTAPALRSGSHLWHAGTAGHFAGPQDVDANTPPGSLSCVMVTLQLWSLPYSLCY
jgi:hypothetical protein